MSQRRNSHWDAIREAPMAWDNSDVSPVSPTPRDGKRPPPTPVRIVKVKDATGRPVARLPGVTEAAPNAAPAPPRRRRSDTTIVPPLSQNTRPPQTSEPTAVSQQAIQLMPGESSWDVTIPGDGTYRVPAANREEAVARLSEFMQDQGDRRQLDPKRIQVTPSPRTSGAAESATVGGSMGGQAHADRTYEEALGEAIRRLVRETVRKKAGGGGYALYSPNKGKRKKPRKVGEFPTRLAAKRAELAQFPPKDPEQLKNARSRLDRIAKDPKKRSAAERDDLSGRKHSKRSGSPARSRKKAARESLTRQLTRDLRERLFHEDEIPGSPWDERIASLHPDAISSDRRLHGLHKATERASLGSLMDAHKALAKALRRIAKTSPGDVAHDAERRKTFMPVMLDCGGVEIGPVHLYIDGGHVKVEVSQDARQQIGGLDPDVAHDLRGGLMSFQEDHLPRIDGAQNAWKARDSYLDKLHGRLEKHAAGLSGVEHHLLKQLLSKGAKRR